MAAAASSSSCTMSFAAASSTVVDTYHAAEQQLAKARLESFPTRTSTRAADEFFAGNKNLDWKTLPHRIRQLTDTFEGWTAERGSPELPFYFSNNDAREARRIALTAAILAAAPPSFLPAFCSLFQACLEYHQDAENNEELAQVFSSNQQLIDDLNTLGWLGCHQSSSLLQQPLLQAIHKAIYRKVQETIAGDYETPDLYLQVTQWKDEHVAVWLRKLLGENDQMTSDIDRVTAECYCLVRMNEIFDMVADYPDSHTAVVELKQVLQVTKLQSQVGHALKQSLIRRLNHPGANTSQIIDVYIATIKVLRVIDDESGGDLLLRLVAEPVRAYLRGRADTVRCIITSLTEDQNGANGNDLYQELRRQDAKPLENVVVDSDDEEECPDFDWQPPPSIFSPRRGGNFLEQQHTAGNGDILAMLVSIYGSKELFVNEYRLMLADKLLANLDYNTDKQVHTLELLKLRFGELSMRNAEVMIKDMYDSKRTNANIQSTLETRRNTTTTTTTPFAVDAAMISHIFWPTLVNNDALKHHHPRIQAQLDEFSTEYARLKNPRKLIWLEQLGTVQLELDFVIQEEENNMRKLLQTKSFTCTPLQATLISHFEDQTEWTVAELSNETGVPEHVLQRRMAYWVNHGVIVKTKTTIYQLASQAQLLQQQQQHEEFDDEDEEDYGGRAVSVTAQEEEEMQVYESYIVGMLTNLQQLPLERIHNMLKMFVTSGGSAYNKTPQQLSVFLQHLCKQEKLECGPDGLYKLFKK